HVEKVRRRRGAKSVYVQVRGATTLLELAPAAPAATVADDSRVSASTFAAGAADGRADGGKQGQRSGSGASDGFSDGASEARVTGDGAGSADSASDSSGFSPRRMRSRRRRALEATGEPRAIRLTVGCVALRSGHLIGANGSDGAPPTPSRDANAIDDGWAGRGGGGGSGGQGVSAATAAAAAAATAVPPTGTVGNGRRETKSLVDGSRRCPACDEAFRAPSDAMRALVQATRSPLVESFYLRLSGVGLDLLVRPPPPPPPLSRVSSDSSGPARSRSLVGAADVLGAVRAARWRNDTAVGDSSAAFGIGGSGAGGPGSVVGSAAYFAPAGGRGSPAPGEEADMAMQPSNRRRSRTVHATAAAARRLDWAGLKRAAGAACAEDVRLSGAGPGPNAEPPPPPSPSTPLPPPLVASAVAAAATVATAADVVLPVIAGAWSCEVLLTHCIVSGHPGHTERRVDALLGPLRVAVGNELVAVVAAVADCATAALRSDRRRRSGDYGGGGGGGGDGGGNECGGVAQQQREFGTGVDWAGEAA
ncbi:unnamed protein product, partial [Phaeothamnion confervicola]